MSGPPAPHHICWYLEHLAARELAAPTISNHLSAIRTYFKMVGLDSSPLFSQVVLNAIRGIATNIRHIPKPTLATSPELLIWALQGTHTLQYPEHIKLAIVWMLMAFLRQSNLLPKTTAGSDPTRHLTRSDVTVNNDLLTIHLKWSKTMQKSQTSSTVSVWALPASPLCPVAAYEALLQCAPTAYPGQPLLQYRDGNPMTAQYVGKSWASLLKLADIPKDRLTLHRLRLICLLRWRCHPARHYVPR